jgi:hypothetical protein
MLAFDESALPEFACSECNRSLAIHVLSFKPMLYGDCCPLGRGCSTQFRPMAVQVAILVYIARMT